MLLKTSTASTGNLIMKMWRGQETGGSFRRRARAPGRLLAPVVCGRRCASDAALSAAFARGGLCTDTLLRSAARHGVTVENLRSWNTSRIGKGDLIKVGDVLHIRKHPGYVAPDQEKVEGPTWEGYYDIKRGDTLGKVSQKLKVYT